MARARPTLMAILSVFAVMLACAAEAIAQPQGPRLTIWMFRVPTEDKDAQRGFNDWYNLFSNNLSFTAKGAVSGATFLDGLRVGGEDPKQSPADEVLKRRWDEVSALQVLSAVSLRDANATVIDSRIFLGKLQGELPSDWLHIRQRVVATNFSVNNDAIALVTLYALAMDSQRLHRAPAITCGFLAEAHTIAASPDLGRLPELKPLGSAINASLKKNGCEARGK